MLDVTRAYGLNFLFPARDNAVGECLRIFGEFARPEVDLLRAYMEAGPPGALIDVGANVGSICLPLAAARPDWRVLAFEAHRGLAGILSANVLNNHLPNLEAFHAAVGAERAIVEFPTPSLREEGNFGEGGFHQQAPLEPILMRCLDEAAPADTRIVKVDVEGFEAEVFKGARRLIGTPVVWLFEWKANQAAVRANLAMFAAAGYRLFWFFAPFVTRDTAKRGEGGRARGDFNCLALPAGAPNLWDLIEITDPAAEPPKHGSHYGYLGRYGYVWRD